MTVVLVRFRNPNEVMSSPTRILLSADPVSVNGIVHVVPAVPTRIEGLV